MSYAVFDKRAGAYVISRNILQKLRLKLPPFTIK